MNNVHPKVNGQRTARDKIIQTLEQSGGRLPMGELVELARIKQSDLEDLLEGAKCPIGIEIKYNGNPCPATIVALRDYRAPKPRTQAEVAQTLAAMSPQQYEEFLCRIDPTYRCRRLRTGYGKGKGTPEIYYGNGG